MEFIGYSCVYEFTELRIPSVLGVFLVPHFSKGAARAIPFLAPWFLHYHMGHQQPRELAMDLRCWLPAVDGVDI